MILRIGAPLVQLISAQAAAELPEECCGVLVGVEGPEGIEVREAHAAQNLWEGDRTRRFLLDPRVQLNVQRECRGRGLDVVGFYHSHPDGTAAPSAFDAERAWPEVTYLIVGLRGGLPPECRAWRLDAEGGAFVELTVEMV